MNVLTDPWLAVKQRIETDDNVSRHDDSWPLVTKGEARQLLAEVEAARVADRAANDAVELELRKALWLGHGCQFAALYGDDGEMQCHAGSRGEHPCGRPLDFKRDPLLKLVIEVCSIGILRQADVARLTAEQSRLKADVGNLLTDLRTEKYAHAATLKARDENFTDLARLRLAQDQLTQARDSAIANGLDLAARLSFVCRTDTPDTERRSNAVLVERVSAAEASLSVLQTALTQLHKRLDDYALDTADDTIELFADELAALLAPPEEVK